MRYLLYTNYESGNSGLSNGIMSIEVGVGLAFLTNRFLVLDGNVSPPANLVSYGGRVDQERASRVTDLLDLPVPWAEPGQVDLAGFDARELTDEHLGQLVLYFPSTLDVDSEDARHFARGRTTWVHPAGELSDVPVLKVTEEPIVLGGERHRNNLSFYGYTFYLDDEHRRSLYRVYDRMRPKPELAELARRVAGDLGPFNAVHLRRGDFKLTYGVTTLDRQPWEAIEAMDRLFSRDEPLVILTDEREDPFFHEIRSTYPHHLFIDHHILDEYGDAFSALPTRDSLALAYLSQLVAAESEEFLGTMTSTFTALIQRYRGNRGKNERFRFLWNELPDGGDRVERGRHAMSECVPLEDGQMVEEFDGPYSWNRVNQRLAPSWMREWPESFLTKAVLETGALSPRSESETDLAPPEDSSRASRPSEADITLVIPFAGVEVTVRTRNRELANEIATCFRVDLDRTPENLVAEWTVTGSRSLILKRDERAVAEATDVSTMVRTLKQEIASVLCIARPRHTWLDGSAFMRAGRALVVTGQLGAEAERWTDALGARGWDLLVDDWVPIRHPSRTVLPFGRSARSQGIDRFGDSGSVPLGSVLIGSHRLTARDDIRPLSPSVAVAELIGSSLDVRQHRRKAVERLCALAAEVPVLHLSFSLAESGAALIEDVEELSWGAPSHQEMTA